MVASAVAAFELVLLVMISLAFLGDSLSGSTSEPARATRQPAAAEPATPTEAKKKPAPERKKAVTSLSRAETSVIILNGNGVQGAAAQASEQVRRFPYLITGTGNAPRTDFARSLVMYRAGFRGEAARLAEDLGIGRVAPLDGLRPGDLQGAQLALIVGAS